MELSTPPLQSPDFACNQVDLDELERLNRKVLILQKTICSMHRIEVEQSGSWSPRSTIMEKEDKQRRRLIKRAHKEYVTKRS